jgi:hypothetical protein
VITDEDPDDDENGNEAGETSTGGRATGGSSATGGTSTGGKTTTGGTSTGGTTGGSSTGGTGEGGTGGEPPASSCVVGSTPADSCEFADSDGMDCSACLSMECCEEVKACYGSEPDDVCGWPAGEGEFDCVRLCLASIYAEGDVPTQMDVSDCIDECDTCMAAGSALPNLATGMIASCMNDACADICYEEALALP